MDDNDLLATAATVNNYHILWITITCGLHRHSVPGMPGLVGMSLLNLRSQWMCLQMLLTSAADGQLPRTTGDTP